MKKARKQLLPVYQLSKIHASVRKSVAPRLSQEEITALSVPATSRPEHMPTEMQEQSPQTHQNKRSHKTARKPLLSLNLPHVDQFTPTFKPAMLRNKPKKHDWLVDNLELTDDAQFTENTDVLVKARGFTHAPVTLADRFAQWRHRSDDERNWLVDRSAETTDDSQAGQSSKPSR